MAYDPEKITMQRDFNLMEIPLEGVAAYWLSIKKIVEGKRNFKALQPEVEHTSEPYIHYLLDVVFSNLDLEQAREMIQAKRETLLRNAQLKLDLMRISLLDIASGENPRKTLAKMAAQFTTPPLTEDKALSMVQELMRQAQDNPGKQAAYYNVSPQQKHEQLMVALLFYVLWARHEGKIAMEPFYEFMDASYFRNGLALVIDGFDTPFVRKCLKVHRDSILQDTRTKMTLSEHMCLAIRKKLSYDDVFRVAKAYLS